MSGTFHEVFYVKAGYVLSRKKLFVNMCFFNPYPNNVSYTLYGNIFLLSFVIFHVYQSVNVRYT
jgi:hypothetical protein